MTREFLQALKISDEQIESIMKEHGKTVNSTKKELETKQNELVGITDKLNILEKQNKETEKILKDNKDLTKQFEELQSTSKQQLEAKEKELKNYVTTNIIKDKLTEMGAVYPDLLIKNINLEEVIIKDNKILNAETALNPLKDSYKELFKEKNVQGNTNPSTNQNNSPANPALSQLQEQLNNAVKEGNTALAMQLQDEYFELQNNKE